MSSFIRPFTCSQGAIWTITGADKAGIAVLFEAYIEFMGAPYKTLYPDTGSREAEFIT